MSIPIERPQPPVTLPGIAGRWRISETQVDLSTGAVIPALRADPERWYFSVASNVGGLYIATAAPPSGVPNNWGYPVGVNGFEKNYRDHGALVQIAWYFNQPGPGLGFAYVLTVSWR